MSLLRRWLDRNRLAYVTAALVLGVVGWRLTHTGGSRTPDAAVAPRPVVEVRTPTPEAARAMVHVVGAVRRPGVYRLADNARVVDAVRRAGGAAPRADLSGVNLAASVVDGQQIHIPTRGAPASAAPASASPTGSAAGPISLSRATAQQLEELDGIGPALAQRIVDWREANGAFDRVEDLLEVPGIGEARLEALRSRVVP